MAWGGSIAVPAAKLEGAEDTAADTTGRVPCIVAAAISYVMWSVSDISDEGWLDSAEPCLIRS
jgi:hypothetical protein